MQVEFESMSALLEPGQHLLLHTQFGLSEDFAGRINEVASALTIHLNRVIAQIHTQNETTTESELVQTAFGLIDQHVRPQSAAEIACAAYLISSMLEQMMPIIERQEESVLLRQQLHEPSHPPSFFGPTNATA